jgi:small subunit ribosomal protein S3
MISKYFVKQGIKENQIQQFIKTKFPTGDYSDIVLERTPIGLKIVIHTNKPGRIIGRGGKNINDMTDALREKFKLENPQLDVKSIDNPNLDSNIVAKQLASALERGYNYRKIGNLAIKRIMGSGAVGVQIIISGKLGGSKGLKGKFTEGYLKHCGQPAKDLVDYGFQEASTRPGKIGVKVKIMKEFVDISGAVRKKEIDVPVEAKEEIVKVDSENNTVLKESV